MGPKLIPHFYNTAVKIIARFTEPWTWSRVRYGRGAKRLTAFRPAPTTFRGAPTGAVMPAGPEWGDRWLRFDRYWHNS